MFVPSICHLFKPRFPRNTPKKLRPSMLLSNADVAWLNWEPEILAASRRARPKNLARSLARYRPTQQIPSKHVPWLEQHSDASLVLRPRFGGDWTLAGSALRVLHDPTAPHLSPYLAHGQLVTVRMPLPSDAMVMLYDAKVINSPQGYGLYADEGTAWVRIPSSEKISFAHTKEVCAGIGCMGMAAEFLGLESVASMDWNINAVHHMQLNHRQGAFVGDVNLSRHRLKLHHVAEALRCILLCGFPCQPLSRQGDGKGDMDSRSRAFHSTLRVVWEQQMSALVMECVPGAREAPFGTESLTFGGLAILTTSVIPPGSQGLLPVSNLRFPALFVPTGEPILIDGSILQLGDKVIQRVQETNAFQIVEMKTSVIKVTVFRDEWPLDWTQFGKTPVKELFHHVQTFLLCRGNRCGEACKRFHAPVDTEIDAVVTDVWSRLWLTHRGKKVGAEDSDLFQVMFRIPHECLKTLHWLSGVDGVYVEPRSEDGRSADPNMQVLWFPELSLKEVLHKQRTTERTLPVVRFGMKYGIRIYVKDSDQLQSKPGAGEQPPHINIQKIYELRPFPHGTQKKAIAQLLQSMGWQAKPVQPGRADSNGMSWKVGAEADPPSMVVQTSSGDITITLQKQVVSNQYAPKVFGSTKTQAHLRQQSKDRSKSSQASALQNKENVPPYQAAPPSSDPWQKNDPWRSWSGPKPVREDVDMQVTPKLDQIEERL
eukprot:s140_g67.t1